MIMKSTLLTVSIAGIAIIGSGVMMMGLKPEKQYTQRKLVVEQSNAAAGASAYMHMLRANQITGEFSSADMELAIQQLNAFSATNKTAALGLSWDFAGPDNVGGRTRCFVIDKDNSNVLYTAGVAGGIFKSTNAALSWIAIGEEMENKAVVSMTQAANGDLYAGTGENMYAPSTNGIGGASSSGMTGAGIYKSTDGGATWTRLTSTVPPPNNPSSPWSAVGALGADPTSGNRIYAATLGGLRKSDDGGATWTNPIAATLAVGRATDLTVATNGGVWVNIDGKTIYSPNGNDNTWVEVSKTGLGANILPRSQGRQRYAISPQDPNTVYCVQTAGEALSGVFRTLNNGETWTRIGQKTPFFDPLCQSQCQGNWNLLLEVSASDKNHIFLGGITMWEWKQTGGWRQVDLLFDFPGNPWYIHADKHYMKFDPKNPNIVYALTDGGVSKSSDGGETWGTFNRNYSTSQYYHIDFGEDRTLVGGTQDNGSHVIDGKGNTPLASRDLGPVNNFSGDGGYSRISWLNSRIYFTSYQQGRMGRSENAGESFTSFYSNRINVIGPPLSAWMIPYHLYETTNDPLSEDSILFKAFPASQSLGFGGGLTSFTSTIRRPQDAAQFIASSFRIVSGALVIQSDAQGNLSGAGTGTFDANTGNYSVTFSSTPLAEIVVTCNVRYIAGSSLRVQSLTNGLPFNFSLTQTLEPNDSIKIQDPVQNLFAAGFNGSVWVTRKALDFSATPEWWKVGAWSTSAQNPNNALCIEFSADGNYLWVGTSNGQVVRVSNLSQARDIESADMDFATSPVVTHATVANYGGRVITGIAVDPNNPDRVAVTVGNYGNTSYVYYSSNATSATPTFVSKQGNLPQFPAYSVTFDKGNPAALIVGTEYGIFTTDNINAPSVSWSEENNGFPRVPVFTLRQYRTNKSSASNTDLLMEGDIFAGTHGRGIFRTTSLMSSRPVSVPEEDNFTFADRNATQLVFAPNPAKEFTTLELNIVRSEDVNIFVRDLNGRLVKQMKLNKMPAGKHDIRLETETLANGNYIVTVQMGNTLKSGKLLVTK
jgi:hypothetical protein